MVPQKEQDDGRYQPPRSPGYNEYILVAKTWPSESGAHGN
jgi:hypothetical protein